MARVAGLDCQRDRARPARAHSPGRRSHHWANPIAGTVRAKARSTVRLPSDARTAIARAILAASTTLAFLSPWWWAPAPELLPLTVLFAVLAAAAVSWRPDGRLVALGAGLGALVQPLVDTRSPLLPLLMAAGAVYGAVATEIARLATVLREDRPLLSVDEAVLAGGGIVLVSSVPWAFLVGSGSVLALIGMAMGGAGLARRARASLWLLRVASGREAGAALRDADPHSDSDAGLPTWSLLGPARAPAKLLVLDPPACDPAGASHPTYRSAGSAVAIVRPARAIAASRARPWLLAIGAVGLALVVMVVSVPRCECGRTASHVARAETDARALRRAAEHRQAVTGDCPSPAELVTAGEIDPSSWLDDPWGNAYRITCEGGEVTVTSSGPDNLWDTADDVPTK